jgi:hypothetical protein
MGKSHRGHRGHRDLVKRIATKVHELARRKKGTGSRELIESKK